MVINMRVSKLNNGNTFLFIHKFSTCVLTDVREMKDFTPSNKSVHYIITDI